MGGAAPLERLGHACLLAFSPRAFFEAIATGKGERVPRRFPTPCREATCFDARLELGIGGGELVLAASHHQRSSHAANAGAKPAWYSNAR